MDAKRLMYFCTIVEQGQISRAARVLNMSQPPLSQRMKELEDELGVTLIIRDGRNWQITEAGRVLYERAHQLLAMLEEIPFEVKNAEDGFSSRLIVGATTMCLSRLLRVAPIMHNEFPNLRFKLVVGDSNFLENMLKKRQIDFAIMLPASDPEAFEVIPLPASSFSAVYSDRIEVEKGKKAVTLEELRSLPLLVCKRVEGTGVFDNLSKIFKTAGISPNIVVESPDCRTLADLIANGMKAVAVIPSSEVPEHILKKYVVLPIDLAEYQVEPMVVRLKDHYLTTAAQTMIHHFLTMEEQRQPPLDIESAAADRL